MRSKRTFLILAVSLLLVIGAVVVFATTAVEDGPVLKIEAFNLSL